MKGRCRACGGKAPAGKRYHQHPCFALPARSDSKPACAVCNRVLAGDAGPSALYCTTPVCQAYRSRTANARTKAIARGEIVVVHRCSCGQRLEHDLTVGRPRQYCSEVCATKEHSVREKEAAAARRSQRPFRDYSKCSKCLVNDRPVKGDGTLRSWCKPCENRSKRERPNPNLKLRARGLRPGRVLTF